MSAQRYSQLNDDSRGVRIGRDDQGVDVHVLLVSEDGIVRLELVLGEKVLALGNLDVKL